MQNADRSTLDFLKKSCRFAQAAPMPQAPAATPTQSSPGLPAAPVSAQTPNAKPPTPSKIKTPMSKSNCTVTFDHRHIVIEIPDQPAINLSLTEDQQASVEARLAQDTFGKQGPPGQGPATPPPVPGVAATPGPEQP